MSATLIWFYLFQTSFVLSQNYVTFLGDKNPNTDHDAYVVQTNCSNAITSLYFDNQMNKWTFSSADSCLHSLNDILSYCQRVYPELNVINIQLVSEKIGFKICDPTSCSVENGALFKCLYGAFKSKTQFQVPVDCQFEHLARKSECKTTENWKNLANQKCQSFNKIFHVTNYSMIQWCDAFKDGIETFNGIEFICCPNKLKNVRIEDENIDSQQFVTNYYSDDVELLDSNNLVYNVKLIDKPKKDEKFKFLGYATTFFLIGFFMTVFVFIFYRIFKKNRKSDILRQRLGQHIDKDQDSQLNQMQINGYENPTYKFFDDQNGSL
ncbi:amyloid beta A4 isoform X5 [Brachionus plicatilis]|uniref:Amyloid beta A4 isoform X5 n=1 Tax=Brachionus plicatilis TaxID=10195 RepID=A0A3M7SZN0_BRAPC|nr:amyloid beta A4 isoform X5 [Brachionus plicatilis]